MSFANNFDYKCKFCDFECHEKVFMWKHIKQDHENKLMKKKEKVIGI